MIRMGPPIKLTKVSRRLVLRKAGWGARGSMDSKKMRLHIAEFVSINLGV